jgi:hypothetical protein
MMGQCDFDRRRDEITVTAIDHVNAVVERHHDRLAAAGVRVDGIFHSLMIAAFVAGAASEAGRREREACRAAAAGGKSGSAPLTCPGSVCTIGL